MKKKLLTICAAALICAAFTGCGNNSSGSSSPTQSASSALDCAGKADAVCAAVDFTVGDKTVDKQKVSDLSIFGIDPADVTDSAAYIVGSGATPDRFGIIEAKDADAAKRVLDAVNSHIAQQKKVFIDEGYTPAEKYKFDDFFAEANGNTVIFAVTADNAKVKELLK